MSFKDELVQKLIGMWHSSKWQYMNEMISQFEKLTKIDSYYLYQ